MEAWPYFVSGGATLIAAIVALFGDRLRSLMFKPKLSIRLKNPVGYLVSLNPRKGSLVASEIPEGRHTRWYHLVLENTSVARWPAANDARVYLTKLEQDIGGVYTPLWELTVPLIFRHEAAFAPRRVLGPPIDVDLMYVHMDRNGAVPELRIQAHPSIATVKVKFTGATHLRATILADCVESAFAEIAVTIRWDGKWNPGDAEMRNHLHIS
jgi:hypothetical protein